jgi:hypothetical protein
LGVCATIAAGISSAAIVERILIDIVILSEAKDLHLVGSMAFNPAKT